MAPRKSSARCLCGCGQLPRGGKFLPGHDARLAARLNKLAARGDEKAIARLEELGWVAGRHPISVLKVG